MKKIGICLLLLAGAYTLKAQNDEQAIRKLLATQTVEWNKGNVEGFMQTYWNSDSLLFIGKSGVTHGYAATLNNYRKGYPDTAAMGKLAFDIITVQRVSADAYFVVGKWMLTRSIGNVQGHYSLLLRRIRGQWKIVADHSS